jgi:hypothetical protein
MKAVLGICFLCFTSAWAQDVPSDIVLESAVPSVQISFAGQDGPNYRFLIRNTSEHGITAFNLRLVPKGSVKAVGKLLCDSGCGENGELGTKSRPVISQGGTFQLTFPISGVQGGLLIEAAVFNDDTFQGDESAAARLLAEKIGFQAEYDRILSAVDKAMSVPGLDDPGKALLVRQELEALPVAPDPETVQKFQQRFPNLPDCGDQCAQIMEGASSNEKQVVLTKFEQFSSRDNTSETSLAQWWKATKAYITDFGCDNCTAGSAKSAHE